MINVFGTVIQDVIRQSPTNMGEITTTSKPINTETVEEYIMLGAAQINGVLQRANIDSPTLDNITTYICKQAVISFAVYRILETVGNPNDPRNQRALDQFNALKDMIKDSPQDLGNQMSASSTIHSNLDAQSLERNRNRFPRW